MIVKKRKRQRYSRKYRCHHFASQYALQLVNSGLIDEQEMIAIPQSTLSTIVGKTVKIPELSPDKHKARLIKLFQVNDKAPVVTKKLSDNINSLVASLKLGKLAADIIQFAATMTLNKGLQELVDNYAFDTIDSVGHLLSELLSVDELSIEIALEEIWKTGLLVASPLSEKEPLALPRVISRQLVMGDVKNSGDILESILVRSPDPELTLSHFDYLDIKLTQQYLTAAIKGKTNGVNILFHGIPGTGKTQMCRILAKAIGAKLYDIVSVGDNLWDKQEAYDADENSGALRLQFNQLTQKLLARTDNSLLILDEAEDLFASLYGSNRLSKEALHNVLETNKIPTIWVTNHVNFIDESCLRRFKMVVEFPTPSAASIKTLIDNSLTDLGTSEDFRKQLANTKHITMANINSAASVVKQVGYQQEKAEQHITTLIQSTLHACGHKQAVQYQGALSFNLDYINLSGNQSGSINEVNQLIEATNNHSSARTLLTGPAGTGKTALVNHLAQALDIKLITIRGSDILSKYVGEAEQNVARVFKEAAESKSVLFFDEIDSLLASREGMHNSCELQLVNEILTQMECFKYPLFAATNFEARLDKAVMRRFDFKLHFAPLTTQQVTALFCETLHCKSIATNIGNQLQLLRLLTPGDFAIIERRNQFNQMPMTQKEALVLLKSENDRKTPSKPIGFI